MGGNAICPLRTKFGQCSTLLKKPSDPEQCFVLTMEDIKKLLPVSKNRKHILKRAE